MSQSSKGFSFTGSADKPVRRSRTPRPDNPSRLAPARLRRSTLLAIYLYLSAHNRISDQQREFIAHFQAKLNLAEIQSALKFAHTLTTDPRTRARLQVDNIQVPTRRSRPKIRETRRIGVGYRDKGSLRSSHRPALPGEVTLGAEAQSLWWDVTPSWIFSGERKSAGEVLQEWHEAALRVVLPFQNLETLTPPVIEKYSLE